MKTLHILSHLLLICLLLLPYKGYAAKPAYFDVQAARHNSKPGNIYGSTPQEVKKVYKQPSGPNPAGNNRPPSNR
ncbi:CLAVATA3/ESR (CLE)-related protein 46-like [Bidens hawaiensis]|uniref:CLAVATA3/ESR (CLE)-related protein 46-like n=1 Tax=Bidens hawaiensis TaxID=980011 RepID=UPI00404B44FF